MTMHNPPHPGEVIRELCLQPLGVSVTDAARSLGVTRKALSEAMKLTVRTRRSRSTVSRKCFRNRAPLAPVAATVRF